MTTWNSGWVRLESSLGKPSSWGLTSYLPLVWVASKVGDFTFIFCFRLYEHAWKTYLGHICYLSHLNKFQTSTWYIVCMCACEDDHINLGSDELDIGYIFQRRENITYMHIYDKNTWNVSEGFWHTSSKAVSVKTLTRVGSGHIYPFDQLWKVGDQWVFFLIVCVLL